MACSRGSAQNQGITTTAASRGVQRFGWLSRRQGRIETASARQASVRAPVQKMFTGIELTHEVMHPA